MPRFTVLATELVTQHIVFHVEAENEDAARDKVINGDFDASYITEQYSEDPIRMYSVEEV
jgi:N-formylglutamate amidohydrolase